MQGNIYVIAYMFYAIFKGACLEPLGKSHVLCTHEKVATVTVSIEETVDGKSHSIPVPHRKQNKTKVDLVCYNYRYSRKLL